MVFGFYGLVSVDIESRDGKLVRSEIGRGDDLGGKLQDHTSFCLNSCTESRNMLSVFEFNPLETVDSLSQPLNGMGSKRASSCF